MVRRTELRWGVMLGCCVLLLACERAPQAAPEARPEGRATPVALGPAPSTPRVEVGASPATSTVEPSGDEKPASASRPATPGGTPRTKPSPPSGQAYRLPTTGRLVAIGDVHGDVSATRQALELGGAIDGSAHWVGGALTVVQTGDQLDRGNDEQEIIELLDRLRVEADKAGGRVIVLNGNHETMNTLGDFRYVTQGALDDFHGLSPRSRFAHAVPAPYHDRAAAFLPGGALALRLAARPVIVQVGDTVFVHGGLRPEHVTYGIDRINREIASFMRGESPQPPAPMVEEEGPLWTRVYGDTVPPAESCALLRKTLQMLSARRLVVGHTVQKGGITSACDDQVYRIDVGLSAYYGGVTIEVLELMADQVKVLSAARWVAGSPAEPGRPAPSSRAPTSSSKSAPARAPVQVTP